MQDFKNPQDYTYIHYGSDGFDASRFEPVHNAALTNKPLGGLWASPEGGYGWKEWNDDNQYRECNPDNAFRFRISDQARVLVVQSTEDVAALLRQHPADVRLDGLSMFGIASILGGMDFEALCGKYDAVLVFINQETYYALYGWDCDTLLVLNPDIIEPQPNDNVDAGLDTDTAMERADAETAEDFDFDDDWDSWEGATNE